MTLITKKKLGLFLLAFNIHNYHIFFPCMHKLQSKSFWRDIQPIPLHNSERMLSEILQLYAYLYVRWLVPLDVKWWQVRQTRGKDSRKNRRA